MPQALDPAARLRNMNAFPRGVSQTFMRRERAVITAEIRAARSALTCSPGHQNEGLGVPAVSRSRRHGYATRYCSRQRAAACPHAAAFSAAYICRVAASSLLAQRALNGSSVRAQRPSVRIGQIPHRQASIHIYAQLHHGSSRAIEANRSLLPKGR